MDELEMLICADDAMEAADAGDDGVGWISVELAEKNGFTREAFEKWAEKNHIEAWFQKNGWKIWRV